MSGKNCRDERPTEEVDNAYGCDPQKYLVVRIGPEEFGIEFAIVWGVLHKTTIIPVPKSNGLLQGFVLLGQLQIPVVNLSWKLRLKETQRRIYPNTVLLARSRATSHRGIVGITVSEVTDVTWIGIQQNAGHFDSPTRLAHRDSASDLVGKGGQPITLLNIDKILASSSCSHIR
jgi:chemotaxis signal transduction protein